MVVTGFLIALALNFPAFSGQTALHKAAANQRRSICYMLVAAGANLSIQDNEGKTPKVLALLADDHSLAAYLESK